jgi:hypothetical protein
MTVRHLEELLDLALAEIGPPEQKKATCYKSINEKLRLINIVRHLDAAPGPGEFKRELETYADSLKKTKGAHTQLHETTRALIFRGLPEAVGPIDQDRFLKDVDDLIFVCEFTIEHLQVGPGSPRWSSTKHVCAFQARKLLEEFSPSRLSKSKDGHFFKLASLLYEIASGEKEKDLSTYCENPDRTQPLYAMKIPSFEG